MFLFDDNDDSVRSHTTSKFVAACQPATPVAVRVRQSRPHSVLVLLCSSLALLIFVSGCGRGGKPWERVYAASGKVKFAGRPVNGAMLTLFPKDKSFPTTVRPTARTDDTGNFSIGTKGEDDGAPAGEYDVAITWRPVVGDAPGPNLLPVKYSSPETSQLTLKIEAGEENELQPLELIP